MSPNTPQLKTPKKRTAYFYNQNNAASVKKHRSSLSNGLRIVQDDVGTSATGVAADHTRSLNTPDRFIAAPIERCIPPQATPRSRRFAYALGLTPARQLPLTSISSSSGAPLHSFRKGLTTTLYGATSSNSFAPPMVLRAPEQVLCAPDLADDFYARPAAWSPAGVLVIASPNGVNGRNMYTGAVNHLFDVDTYSPLGNVGSPTQLEWSPKQSSVPDVLAVGFCSGAVWLYDTRARKLLHRLYDYLTDECREDGEESNYVGGLSWNGPVLTVGYKSGYIRHFDIRAPASSLRSLGSTLWATDTYSAHKARVCAVRWNKDVGGGFLASGGGEERVCCWDARAAKTVTLAVVGGIGGIDEGGYSGPLDESGIVERAQGMRQRWRRRLHNSTVKALAWCPWRTDVLATGGGTQDGTIRLWSVSQAPTPAPSPFTSSTSAYASASTPISAPQPPPIALPPIIGHPQPLHSTSTYPRPSAVPTFSQISSLIFSPNTKEILSTHGYAWVPNPRAPATMLVEPETPRRIRKRGRNANAPNMRAPRTHSILIHAFPSLRRTANAFDNSHGRISHSMLGPSDGGTGVMEYDRCTGRVVTCGADDSVRVWRVWGDDQGRKEKQKGLGEENRIFTITLLYTDMFDKSIRDELQIHMCSEMNE